jgi:L-alanine-DL-glutamate epimerase-like enolase superfamily enzyme
MKTFTLMRFGSEITRKPLRRKFGFGTVVATESDYVSTTVMVDNNLTGEGGSLLMNPWAFPDDMKPHSYEIMPQLLKLCEHTINALVTRDKAAKTPTQYWDLFYDACKVAAKQKWGDLFPELAVSVALAPFEFAIWDAYGKLHNLPWARCVSADFLDNEDFSSVVFPHPSDQTSVLHTMGGFDPVDQANLADAEVARSILANDELPKHLFAEMELGHFRCVKPKVFDDFGKNTARMSLIDEMLKQYRAKHSVTHAFHCYFDANGTIPSVTDLRVLLQAIAYTDSPIGRTTVNFEQPFSVANTFSSGFEVGKLRTFCNLSIDEALVTVDDVRRAHEMGYNRLGLKACKSVTMTLRMAKLATELGMAYDIQDLTQVGRGLVVSASLAAWLGIPMESNGWKNVANANAMLTSCGCRYNGIWLPSNGNFHTGNLTGPGFSAQ